MTRSKALVHAERGIGRDGGLPRLAGEAATATGSGVPWLAILLAFEAVVDGIQAGQYGRPETADGLANVWGAPVVALEAAWTTQPSPSSTVVTRSAEETGVHRLEGTPDPHDVDRVPGRFATARPDAEAVPDVVEHLDALLVGSR